MRENEFISQVRAEVSALLKAVRSHLLSSWGRRTFAGCVSSGERESGASTWDWAVKEHVEPMLSISFGGFARREGSRRRQELVPANGVGEEERSCKMRSDAGLLEPGSESAQETVLGELVVERGLMRADLTSVV